MPDTPHLAYPLRFTGGRFEEVEQASPAHIMQQAEIVVRTRPGMLEAQPGFGLRNLTGTSTPIQPAVETTLREFVPDHELLVTEDQSRIEERIRQVAVDFDRRDG